MIVSLFVSLDIIVMTMFLQEMIKIENKKMLKTIGSTTMIP